MSTINFQCQNDIRLHKYFSASILCLLSISMDDIFMQTSILRYFGAYLYTPIDKEMIGDMHCGVHYIRRF